MLGLVNHSARVAPRDRSTDEWKTSYSWSRQYDHDIKDHIRQQLIKCAPVRDKMEILTFPSRDGVCAETFRSAFPHATIVGIERSRMIAMSCSRYLLEQSNGSSLRLDHYYCISLRDMLGNHGAYTTQWSSTANRPILRKSPDGLGFDFDLAFLDFTGKMETFAKDVNAFRQRHPKCVLGLTFSHNSDMATVSNQFQNLFGTPLAVEGRDCMDEKDNLLHYQNGQGNTKMLFGVINA